MVQTKEEGVGDPNGAKSVISIINIRIFSLKFIIIFQLNNTK